MLTLFAGVCFLLVQKAYSQYHYRDMVSSRQAAADMAAYKAHQVKSIKMKSFEGDGSESDNFFCERKISKDFKKSSLYTRIGLTGVSLMESYFNDNGQLGMTYDSSDLAVRISLYQYDAKGRLTDNLMRSRSNDDDYVNELTETHHYQYQDNGSLKSLVIVKNHKDSTTVYFSCDENMNVTIEKNDKESIIYYYYYDKQNRLTDIVHAVPYKEKMVAD